MPGLVYASGESWWQLLPYRQLTWTERALWLRGLVRRSRSCGRKQRYSRASAVKAADKMGAKNGRSFDVYRCLWCRAFHIGGSVRRGENGETDQPTS